MIFFYTPEVKDIARRLEAVMEDFERVTSKQRLADVKVQKHTRRMRQEMEAVVDRLRRM
jgi:hypothetical protein